LYCEINLFYYLVYKYY